jgi:hypothetical protein
MGLRSGNGALGHQSVPSAIPARVVRMVTGATVCLPT